MSTQYEKSEDVPTEVLCNRVKELVKLITKGEVKHNEFTMRVPAELDRDADVVLSELVRRLNEAEDVNFRKGVRTFFDALIGRTANNYHGIPELQKVCDEENALIEKWAEEALEDLSPNDHNQWLAIHEAFKQGADQYCKDAIRYRKIKKLKAHELSEMAMLAITDTKFDEMVDSL